MPTAQYESSWDDPEHTVSGLLQVISTSLGGDLVIWSRIDSVSHHVDSIDVADTVPSAAQSLAEQLRHDSSIASDGIIADVVRSGIPRVLSSSAPSELADSAFPQPLLEYANDHPMHGLLAVPVPLDANTVGVLITVRHRSVPAYSEGDLRFVESSASRLAALPARLGTPTAGRKHTRWSPRVLRGPPGRFRMLEVLIGAGPPALITTLLGPMHDSVKYRPGTLLILACVFAAVFSGVRAAALSGIVGIVVLWWAFTPVDHSWSLASRGDGLGLVVYVVAVIGVILLVMRLDNARKVQYLERQLSETLLEQSTNAIAVFNRELRFQRVNSPMARISSRSPAEHIGLRPSELGHLASPVQEHLLARVRDRGLPITGHEVSRVDQNSGEDRHFKVNYQALLDLGRNVVGIGVAVSDVTVELAFRRQAERLLQLSEALSTAIDDEQVAVNVSSYLVATLHARCAVAFRRDDTLVVEVVAGFGEREAPAWAGRRMDIGESTPATDAARANASVISVSPTEFDLRYPLLAHRREIDWHQATLSVPLRSAIAGSAVGVIYLGWPTPRPITEEVTLAVGVVSALATLALDRISIADLAHQDEFRHALDAMLDDVTIAQSVRADNGDIVDFRIEFVNGRNVDGSPRSAETVVGRLLCEVYPHWRASGLFDHFRHVVDSGTPFQASRMKYSELIADDDSLNGYWSLQIAKLGDGYIAASRDVSDVVAAEAQVIAATLRAETERTAIELLQAAALPNVLPIRPGMSIAAVYEPADSRQPVGGDWYDAFALDEHRVALVIGDVAGHGRQAAIFMVQLRNLFRALAGEHAEPGAVLIRANDVASGLNEVDGPFVTCCYAVLNVQTQVLQWAQAGHFSPLVIHADGSSTYLDERTGPPLALSADRRYESSSTNLAVGDRVLIFTDGLVERRREHLDVGLARLANEARRLSELAVQNFVDGLAASVTDRFDDLALLCVELTATT
jgi:serine phosphatase RsbU (regulator of sigma subunit)